MCKKGKICVPLHQSTTTIWALEVSVPLMLFLPLTYTKLLKYEILNELTYKGTKRSQHKGWGKSANSLNKLAHHPHSSTINLHQSYQSGIGITSLVNHWIANHSACLSIAFRLQCRLSETFSVVLNPLFYWNPPSLITTLVDCCLIIVTIYLFVLHNSLHSPRIHDIRNQSLFHGILHHKLIVAFANS
jgi:hypothetical protein